MENELDLAIKDISNLYRQITGCQDDLFIMNPSCEIRDLEGNSVNEELPGDLFNAFFPILMSVKSNPKRAMTFQGELPNGDKAYRLIYLPNSAVSPENFNQQNYLGLDAALEVFEETFHALDDTPQNNLRDKSAREALAVLGRYLGMRYLGEQGCSLPIYSQQDVIDISLDRVTKRKNGDCSNGYVDQISFARKPTKEYLARTWLVGLIEQLETMSFEDAKAEVKRIYQIAKNSKNPMGVIEQQGLKYGTVPSLETLALMNA